MSPLKTPFQSYSTKTKEREMDRAKEIERTSMITSWVQVDHKTSILLHSMLKSVEKY